MNKWFLHTAIVLIAVVAVAACGDGIGNGDREEADGNSILPVADDALDTGVGGYLVRVSFNEEAVQADLDAVRALLATYDEDLDYVIQESFPPVGGATLATDAEDFCEVVVAALEAEPFVADASCGPQLEPGDPGYDDFAPDVGVSTSPVCAPGFPDCEDTIVYDTCLEGTDCVTDGGAPALPPTGGELPLAPPDAVPQPGQFQLTVRFNTTVEQDNLDEVGALIRDLSPDAEYLIQESWPPTGVAQFVAETEDVCLALSQELEQASFVDSASCGPWLEPGDIDPDGPVVNDLR